MKNLRTIGIVLIAGLLLYNLTQILMRKGFFNASTIAIENLPLTDLDGKPIDWTNYRQRPMVANFWATWCGPCRSEKPHLSRAQQLLQSEGWNFVSISDEPIATLKSFQAQHPDLGIPIWHLQQSRKLSGIFEIPQTYIINTKGEIVYTNTGARYWDTPENITLLRSLAQ